MPCEVMTLRSELHRLPTYAVSSPLSRLLAPRPPKPAGTCAHSTPAAPSLRSSPGGISCATSHEPGWSPTSSVTIARTLASCSGIVRSVRIPEPEDQAGHRLHGAEIVQRQIRAYDGDVVALLKVNDELHGEHRGDEAGLEQILIRRDRGLNAFLEKGEQRLFNDLAGDRCHRLFGGHEA